jgi:hypothetical protein
MITFINNIYISKQDLFPFLKINTFLIALGTVSVMVHALYSSVAQFSGEVATYKRPLEALHDNVSHALQPPQPTITTCDTDNTATSVKKHDNDNKENCATDEYSACTMTLTVPNSGL